MTEVPQIPLNDGHWVSTLSLGTWLMNGPEAAAAIAGALQAGYRTIDTAARYYNEEAIGQGMRESGLPRDQIQVTTKVRGGDQGYDQTMRACAASCRRLGVEYIDHYLVHWPLPRLDAYVETWQAMIELRRQGLIHSLGVSNFSAAQIDRLTAETGVTPALNQIEMHPHLAQQELRAACAERGVAVQAWGPLGRGKGLLDSAPLQAAAAAHEVSPAQVVLRWLVQHGVAPVPKSAARDRRAQNLDIFSFTLTDDQMSQIDALDQGRRYGKDPAEAEEF
ncbi:MAG TPA: aldo/keto reductase [Beutenbergiaceae bacterium]|nr:aldo/keto reductase [Beutenbergiaceae bacterium]